MGKRNWEPFLFAAAAVLAGLWIAARAFFTPFYRLRAKVGGWDYAWAEVSGRPGHWAAAVLVRAILGLLLFWVALHYRRRGLAAGYWALAVAALAVTLVDFILFAQFNLG